MCLHERDHLREVGNLTWPVFDCSARSVARHVHAVEHVAHIVQNTCGRFGQAGLPGGSTSLVRFSRAASELLALGMS